MWSKLMEDEMDSAQKKLLLKCFKAIEFEEVCDPDPECRGRIALVFACPYIDDLDIGYVDDGDDAPGRLILCRWDVDRLSGETMWMEWDGDCDGWRGPVGDVVGWSWLP
jgi:hypothetical protein